MQTYKLLKEDTVLLCQPHLIDEFGKTGALFLSQINYWLQNNKNGIFHNNEHWIFNTSDEWAKQLRISTRSVNRYLKKFLEIGLIKIQKLSKHKSNRTNYITLNYDYLKTLNEKIEQTCSSSISKIKKNNITNTQNNQTHLHKDKMSQPCGQNVSMVIHKITNIDKNNKSTILKTSKKINEDKSFQPINHQNKQETNREGVINKLLQEPSNTTVQNMFKLWKNKFPDSEVQLNKTTARQLFAAFSLKCDKNMEKWKNYLNRLQSSDFIMSDNFKLSFDWALKFKTIDRIFKGDLGVKDIAVQFNKSLEEEKAINHIKNSNEKLTCQHMRSLILSKIGAIKYNAWFTKVIFVERVGGIQMKAENQFVEDYIIQHYGKFLRI